LHQPQFRIVRGLRHAVEHHVQAIRRRLVELLNFPPHHRGIRDDAFRAARE
jgi:hypothetical protein